MSISAIGSVLSTVSSASKVGTEQITSAIGDFSAQLEKLGKGAVASLHSAENQSITALSGQGSTRDVVEAVMSAEQTLQIAVGVRDKIVAAYLELSRMAI